VFAAGILYSTAGLFTRAIHLDAWTILAWRAVFGVLFLLVWMAVEKPGGLLQAFVLAPRDLALILPAALGGCCYILALKLTTVADVMVIYATVPFVTMAIAWLWTREVPNGRMLAAATAALVGVAVMVAGGAGGGSRLAGIGMTLLMNICFAINLVTARVSPGSTTAIFTVERRSGFCAVAQSGRSVGDPGLARGVRSSDDRPRHGALHDGRANDTSGRSRAGRHRRRRDRTCSRLVGVRREPRLVHRGGRSHRDAGSAVAPSSGPEKAVG